MAFLTKLMTDTDSYLSAYVGMLSANISIATQPLFKTMVVTFIMLYGISLYWGWIKASFGDAFLNVVKIIFIWALITNYFGFYIQWIVNPLTNTPGELAGSILAVSPTGSSGATTGSMNTFLDSVWNRYFDLAGKGTGSVTKYIVYAVIALAAIISIGYAVILIMISKMSLALLLGLAPFFIIGLLFKTTSKFFEAWLQKCINYMLVPILVYAALLIPLTIIENELIYLAAQASASGGIFSSGVVSVSSAFYILFMSLIAFVVLMQVMQMAAGLAGGLSLSTVGVVAGVMRSTSRGASWLNRRTPKWESGKDSRTWTRRAASSVSSAGGRAKAYVTKAWSGGAIRK
jgi:type IV secretion system protein VirB6